MMNRMTLICLCLSAATWACAEQPVHPLTAPDLGAMSPAEREAYISRMMETAVPEERSVDPSAPSTGTLSEPPSAPPEAVEGNEGNEGYSVRGSMDYYPGGL